MIYGGSKISCSTNLDNVADLVILGAVSLKKKLFASKEGKIVIFILLLRNIRL